MRKITFTLAMLTCLWGQAQNILFEEDFETQTNSDLPENWSQIDADGDGEDWLIFPSDYWADNPLTHLNGNFAISFSWANSPLTPDNILTTPKISVPEGVTEITLKFSIGTGNDPNYYAEHYGVYVSTENDFESITGTAPVLEETFSSYGNFPKEIKVSVEGGKDIYVSFRHFDCTDNWFLAVDDIVVSAETLSITDNKLNTFTHTYNSNSKILSLSASGTELSRVTIYNMLGQQVLQKDLFKNEEQIRLDTLNDGIYVGQINGNNGQTETVKFIKN